MSIFDGMNPGQMGEMMKMFEQFMRERVAPTATKPTFRDCWARYKAWGTSVTAGGRQRIRSWAQGQAAAEPYLLEFFGDLPYDQVTLAKGDEYRIWRPLQGTRARARGKRAGTCTVNKNMRVAAACLSYCKQKSFIASNPLEGQRDDPEHHQRDFAICKEDLLELVRHSVPFMRSFLLLLWETGMRSGELRMLEWSEIDLKAGVIELPDVKTKSGRMRRIALTELALWVLGQCPNDGCNPYVFASPRSTLGPMPNSTLKAAWRKARAAAGVVGPKGQPIWLHTLRHTWATDAVTSGIDIKTVMSQGGWAGSRVADRYMNIRDDHRRAAAAKLDERSSSILRDLQNGKIAAKRVQPALHVVKKEDGGGEAG